jgi:hypothetical protein
MTLVTGISPGVFHRDNDDLGTFDDVINDVREIWYSADANSGFDFSELGRSAPNFYNSRFDRIRRIALPPFHKSELHCDTLLELPNHIGISLIGDLSSKLAHLTFQKRAKLPCTTTL